MRDGVSLPQEMNRGRKLWQAVIPRSLEELRYLCWTFLLGLGLFLHTFLPLSAALLCSKGRGEICPTGPCPIPSRLCTQEELPEAFSPFPT